MMMHGLANPKYIKASLLPHRKDIVIHYEVSDNAK
jgi:hypothetical protein